MTIDTERLLCYGSTSGSSPFLTPFHDRHSFTTHLLDDGYDLSACNAQAGIRTVQELLGHKDVNTTMIYYAQTVVMRSEVP